MSEVFAVVMAGGSGTRFWPASRETRPKQLLPLAGGDEALLTATVRRLAPLIAMDHVYIATGAHLAEATRRALPYLPAANILAEPKPRNTAPCIGWATSILAKISPDALVVVLPSDHFIQNEEAFRTVLSKALAAATNGHLTTIGIVPTRPETGYGYVELGGELGGGIEGARRVSRFVEKPDRARAEAYVAGGKHLWNAGMFIYRAKDMMSAIERSLPELANGLRVIADEGGGKDVLDRVFPTLPSISIDVGVMEKEANLAVIPGDFGWNDVGSWESAWELAEKDAKGNALPAGAVAIESQGNIVRTNGQKIVALLGVEDLVVVETGDAILVMPRKRAQDVRQVVEALKGRGVT